MKKKVTREEVLSSIIKLINEHREDVVEEDASLGRLHIGVQTLMWMYDWLCEEYSKVNMERPLEEELKTLVQGDTLGKLADIAMAHIRGDGEYEVEEEPDSPDETVWNVFIQQKDKENSPEGVNALRGPEEMTKAEFMKQCEKFWDNRGTHCDDFEVMYIRLTEVRV